MHEVVVVYIRGKCLGIEFDLGCKLQTCRLFSMATYLPCTIQQSSGEMRYTARRKIANNGKAEPYHFFPL